MQVNNILLERSHCDILEDGLPRPIVNKGLKRRLTGFNGMYCFIDEWPLKTIIALSILFSRCGWYLVRQAANTAEMTGWTFHKQSAGGDEMVPLTAPDEIVPLAAPPDGTVALVLSTKCRKCHMNVKRALVMWFETAGQ